MYTIFHSMRYRGHRIKTLQHAGTQKYSVAWHKVKDRHYRSEPARFDSEADAIGYAKQRIDGEITQAKEVG